MTTENEQGRGNGADARKAAPFERSRRELDGLRGSVKVCEEELQVAGGFTSRIRTEYDTSGRLLVTARREAGGSESTTRYAYSPSGNLIGITQDDAEVIYEYDDQGRPRRIVDSSQPENPITFQYENGSKTKLRIVAPQDYRPNVSMGGSPFDVTEAAPNLPDGGSVTTIFDRQDRPIEIRVRASRGEVMLRAVRVFDGRGLVAEEKQVLDDPIAIAPLKVPEEAIDDLRSQIVQTLAWPPFPYSVAYQYDSQDRVTQATWHLFNQERRIQSSYNGRGDLALEVTHSQEFGDMRTTDEVAYSESVCTYQYDDNNNWTRKELVARSSPTGEFVGVSTSVRRLEYF